MKYAAYVQYKPSQIEWLGAVPDHWEVWKIAHGFQMTGSGTTPPPDNPDWYDGDVCWVTTSELREKVITNTEKKVSQEALKNFSALKVFPEGTLAIAMYGATIGRLAIFGIAAATNQACGVLFGQKAFDIKFVFYWLQAFREQIILLASGGGQPNISQEKVRSIRIACPSIDEQKAIARFLDAKTAQIDALVTQKLQLIAKLKEKRSALIARTVTRGLPPEAAKAAGLEPNPEMKDSGVEWLGQIPVRWQLLPLFRVVQAIQTGPFGTQLHHADYVDDEVPLINPIHLVDGNLRSDSKNTVTPETADRLSRYKLISGDVVFARRGDIGRCGVVLPEQEGWMCGTGSMVVRLQGSQCDPRYFALVFRSSGFSSLLELNAVGTTMLNLNPSILGRMLVPVPSLMEQRSIIAFIEREAEKLDSLTQKVEAAIARLAEYRQALITSAVTGKIDVRTVPFPEEEAA